MKRILALSGCIFGLLGCSFIAHSQSGLCDVDVPFYAVDMSGNPDSIYISPQDVRNSSCCGAVFPDRCIEFEITLDAGAIGIKFDIYSGAVPPGALFYQINCGTLIQVGDVICLSGQGPHTLTFCKPGNNPNQYAITSIPGVAAAPDTYTLEGCSTILQVTGLVDSTVAWMDITSGSAFYNTFLSCTSGCLNTALSTQPGFPSFIDFEVCGMIYSSQCPTIQNYACDTLRVFINPTLQVSISPNSNLPCGTDSARLLTAQVTGQSGAIIYEWFNAFNGSGNSIENDSIFLALSPGDYSVIVKDSLFPACSRDTANISIQFNTEPSIVISGNPTICSGDTTILNVSGTNVYSWSPSSFLSCDSCAVVNAFPPVTTLYHVLGTYANGCTAADSILISVLPSQTVNRQMVICPQERIFAGGGWQNTSGVYSDIFIAANGCDSTIITSLTVLNCDDADPCTADQCVNLVCHHSSGMIATNIADILWWREHCCCR